ncbi:MAG: hypothetical protein IT502_01945 [Rubrivivax sp.]|nr:hypothetical protein [Rubrivivax sp.]
MRRTSTSLGGTGQSIAAPNRSNIWGQHVICGIVGWTGISARPYLHALAKQSPANGQLAAGSYSSYGVATPAKLLDPPLGATVRSLVCAFSSSGVMQDGTSFFTWGGGSVTWGTSSRIYIAVGAEYSIAPANIHVTDGTLHQYALSTKDAKVRAWRDGAYWGDAVFTTGSMPDHGGKITTNINLINNLYQNSWLTYALWLDCDLDSTGLVALLPDLHARPWQVFAASRHWAGAAAAYTHPTLSNARMTSRTKAGGYPAVDYTF